MIPIRVPVTRNRRWVQMTAFGASEVPEVKISAQSVSGFGLEARVVGAHRAQRGVEVLAEVTVGVVAFGEPTAGQDRGEPVGDRVEQLDVSRLGDDQPQWVWVGGRAAGARRDGCGLRPTTAAPVSAAPPSANQVVGRVVEEDGHVRRAGRVEPGVEQGGEAARFGDELRRGPDPIPESQGGARRAVRVGGVGPPSRAAAFGAGMGASPGAGTDRFRSDPRDLTRRSGYCRPAWRTVGRRVCTSR